MPQLKLRLVAVLAAALITAGCQDWTVTRNQTLNDSSLQNLPPVGFNHVYGPSPLDSRDAMSLQRTLFAENAYWEVYLGTGPVQAGFVKLGDEAAVVAARHRATSLTITLATENLPTIDGLLAFPGIEERSGHPGASAYGQDLITALQQSGYDGLTSAEIDFYFSERYEYAYVSWSRTGGFEYHPLLSWQAKPAAALSPPAVTFGR